MTEKKNNSYKNSILKLTKGLLNSITDVCLFVVYFHLQSYRIASGYTDVGKAINNAVHLTKITNANNLARIIYKLKSKGYLEKKEDYLKITEIGKKRLVRLLPVYEKNRPWDGQLYLITYDIPEDRKIARNYLRGMLKRLGCGLLQKSVWLTPYNPKKLISEIVLKYKLAGLVLVSELREGSGIGGKDILTVVDRVYYITDLNKKYLNFIQQVESKKLKGTQLIINYLAILIEDPQIPFELLPLNWLGKQAYNYYIKEFNRLRNYTN